MKHHITSFFFKHHQQNEEINILGMQKYYKKDYFVLQLFSFLNKNVDREVNIDRADMKNLIPLSSIY